MEDINIKQFQEVTRDSAGKIKKNFNKLNTRQRKLLFVLFIVALFSFYYNSIFKPNNSKRRKLNAQLISLDNKITRMNAELPDIKDGEVELKKARAKLKESKETLSFLEKQLPKEGRIPQLLGELIRQASGYSVDFVSIRPEMPKDEEYYPELLIKIQVDSTYNSFVNYLNRLENISSFLKVKDVNIQRTGEDFSGKLKIDFTLSTLIGEGSISTAELEEKVELLISELISEPKKSPFVLDLKTSEQKESLEYTLSGITFRGLKSTAIINGAVYKLGDKIDNKVVKRILVDRVFLSDENGDIVLILEMIR